jgi:hypothetical protein
MEAAALGREAFVDALEAAGADFSLRSAKKGNPTAAEIAEAAEHLALAEKLKAKVPLHAALAVARAQNGGRKVEFYGSQKQGPTSFTFQKGLLLETGIQSGGIPAGGRFSNLWRGTRDTICGCLITRAGTRWGASPAGTGRPVGPAR